MIQIIQFKQFIFIIQEFINIEEHGECFMLLINLIIYKEKELYLYLCVLDLLNLFELPCKDGKFLEFFLKFFHFFVKTKKMIGKNFPIIQNK